MLWCNTDRVNFIDSFVQIINNRKICLNVGHKLDIKHTGVCH